MDYTHCGEEGMHVRTWALIWWKFAVVILAPLGEHIRRNLFRIKSFALITEQVFNYARSVRN